ncbi:exodeoxyribonuclease V subunit gamma [Desulfonema limicola]|nr:exodeoxyribonuclease V subunit gamma [Desulfonema limicola]
MKQFNLYTGNRLETLIKILADVLSSPLKRPLDPEIIIVQSKGMERWISMELAKLQGVCANIQFPFPISFVYDMFKLLMPGLDEESPFDPDVMCWKIMALLPECMSDPEFEQLRNYLGDNTLPGVRHFQLAEKIANIFDQYLLFRPEWIFDWERGRKDDGWQSALWRKLSCGNENLHRAAQGKAFLNILSNSPEALQNLPERISIFGISTLPRFHMQIFDSLSEIIQVNLFLLNPCADYWGDLMSAREMRKIIKRADAKGLKESELYLGSGNSFLASMGMLGRDFFDLINEFHTDEHELFYDPGEETLLSCIQSDILKRTDRPCDPDSKLEVNRDDFSICIHSCHSPMREVEVLYDNLLDMFETNPDIKPRHVLVMTPDIETYAPYIQAVFDTSRENALHIPFSIADRGLRMQTRIIDTFLNILDLTGSRFGASKVLEVLESPAVYKRFNLSESDLDLVRQWIKETRIRWGIDSHSRTRLGLPDISENTWKAGIDRLLLGYAMTGKHELMFKNILPYDNIEGTESAVLGRFLEFIDRLFFHTGKLSQPRSPGRWSETLKKILDSFFHSDEDTEKEIQVVRDVLTRMAEMETRSGFDTVVDINLIRTYLEARLKEDPFGFGFITGGITFCAMLPMRSIPFKTICLIGINSDTYPRQSRPPGFDLMALKPRPGDRSRRNDDRYLFLESLLSARKKLYISYVGQGLHDNSVIPPSVLVSELMDYISRGFKIQNGDIIHDHILKSQKLQAFNPSYFKEQEPKPEKNKLFSYSRENFRTAQCLGLPRKKQEPFISKELPIPDESWKLINLENLCTFFANPSKFLLNMRLGIYLEEKDSVIQEKEDFNLGKLEKYGLDQTLVEKGLQDLELNEFYFLKKQAGELPHGIAGRCLYEKTCRDVNGFVKKIKPYISSPLLKPPDLSIALNGFKLKGRINNLYTKHLVRYRCAAIKPKDDMSAWIFHLALNSMDNGDYPKNTLVAGTDGLWEYKPVENSRQLLEQLMQIYWQGLIKPLPFFPKTSKEYASELANPKTTQKQALKKAQSVWQGNDFFPGETSDSYFQKCFAHCTDPLDEQFQQLSRTVFEPLLSNRIKK